MSEMKVMCPVHGHVATIDDRAPTCPRRGPLGTSCRRSCTVESDAGVDEADLKEAQDHYYSAGGMPSQSATPRKAPWYWRRAAKLWRHIADSRQPTRQTPRKSGALDG